VRWVSCYEPEAEVTGPIRPRPEAILKREKKRQETLRELKAKKSPPPPEKVVVKREAAAIGEFCTWSSCTVPLSVVANRERYADGHEEIWLLLDTTDVDDPCEARLQYRLRTATEERYRQLKCFINLANFTSCAFSMVVNQVVFTMLAYNLLQLHLLREGRKELNKKPMPLIRKRLLPSDNYTIIYWQGYCGRFRPYELVEFLVTLDEVARKKIADKCRRRRLELDGLLENPRPP
jgi:hypothetical protein